MMTAGNPKFIKALLIGHRVDGSMDQFGFGLNFSSSEMVV